MPRTLSLTLLAATLGLAGCSAPTESENMASATLSFVVGDNSGLVKSLASHVTVSSAKVMLKTIQFHSTSDDDSLDFKSEPLVVELDLAGGLTTVGPIDIPVGEYNKVSFRLHKPDSSENSLDPDFYESASGSDRYSVVVTGIHSDTTFVFKSRRTANQRLEFDPPLVITDTTGTVNVTLSVDLNSWFVDSNTGADLNPSDDGDETKIDNAISKSFRGFVDNDKSGN